MAAVELRAVDWLGLVPPVLVGGALLGAATATGDPAPAPALLWLGLALLAVGVVASIDEPSAAVADACPRSRRLRLAERMVVPSVVLACWVGFALALDGRGGISGTTLALCGAGVMTLALALAAGMRRRGILAPAVMVAPGLLLGIVACMLFQPFAGGDLVVLQVSERDGLDRLLWWVAGVLALGGLVWGSADPGRRAWRW